MRFGDEAPFLRVGDPSGDCFMGADLIDKGLLAPGQLYLLDNPRVYPRAAGGENVWKDDWRLMTLPGDDIDWVRFQLLLRLNSY